ncbi:MAG: hypothetical protein QOE00_1228 [Ilumatobacteraceae bacterium]|jgi:hypothetical protein
MTAMDCAQLADAAPELALGVLTGRERAEALEHLDTCSSCRQLVNSLSGVTDELLRSFAPSVQPSPGFEERVLAAIGTPSTVSALPTRRRRVVPTRRGMLASLSVAACIALLVGVMLAIGPSGRPAVAAAEMRTSSGESVGWIYVDRHQPAVVYMSLPGWADKIQRYGSAGSSYSLHLTTRTGADHVVPVTLDSEAAWRATLDIDPQSITKAALVDDRGHVWCQADLAT